MVAPLPICLIFDHNLSYTRGVFRGIEQFAQTRPQWSLVFQVADGLTSGEMKSLGAAGFIAHVVTPKLMDVLISQGKPVVNTSAAIPEAPFPRVGLDNEEVGRIAFRHFRDRGFSHFGFVGSPRYFRREAGFREGVEENLHTCDTYFEQSAKSPSYRRRGMPMKRTMKLKRWLCGLAKPVGIFACHGVWGVQVLEACRLADIRVPEEVAVLCIDNDSLLCERSRPSLSNILVPVEQIGFRAAAVLDSLIRSWNQEPGPDENFPPSQVACAKGSEGIMSHPLATLVPPVSIFTRQSSDVLAGGDVELTEALQFIRRAADRPIDVNDVLRAVTASRRSLERKFREVLHRGIGEEIRRIRIERARNLLSTTLMPVGEVARQSGFTSAQYFSRVFRQETGQTPVEFRGDYISSPRTS